MRPFPLLFLFFCLFLTSQSQEFTCIVLGPEGGSDESLSTSFLVKTYSSPITSGFVSLESGSLISSIRRALKSNSFYDLSTLIYDTDYAASIGIMRDHIRAFLVSHAHLDHVSGLSLASQSELPGSKKKIFGTKGAVDDLVGSIFNGIAWPNMSNRGNNPIGTYEMAELDEENYVDLWEGSDLSASAMPVTHGSLGSVAYNSTAFFIKSQVTQSQFLFFGDVGPDSLSKNPRLRNVWKKTATLIENKQLDTIFIECSYDDSRSDQLLFGHLKPKFVMEELNVLASLVDLNNPKESLRGINVVLIHIKPGTLETGDVQGRIRSQLEIQNDLGVVFRFPKAGDRFSFGGKFEFDPNVNTNRKSVISSSNRLHLILYAPLIFLFLL